MASGLLSRAVDPIALHRPLRDETTSSEYPTLRRPLRGYVSSRLRPGSAKTVRRLKAAVIETERTARAEASMDADRVSVGPGASHR